MTPKFSVKAINFETVIFKTYLLIWIFIWSFEDMAASFYVIIVDIA